MSWVPVYGSSNVVEIRYHEPSRECFVKFTGGTVYCYENVPPEVWEELVHSQSKGRFVNIVLRRGYKYRKVSEAEKTVKEQSGNES